MNIIILGAGSTGASIARSLLNEGNDIVIIDTNTNRLRDLQDRVDIATVTGKGSFPDALEQANIQEADLLIALMQQDEDNMIACQIAWVLYQTPRIIARIRNNHYLARPELFNKNNIPVDTIISPESLVTHYLQNLIEFPGTHQLHDFSNGQLKMVSLDIQVDSQADGIKIQALRQLAPDLLCTAIFHDKQRIRIDPDYLLVAGDRLFYLVPTDKMSDSLTLFTNNKQNYRRIMIAGGGHIGKRLAEGLQENFKIKVIEKDMQRAQLVAETLERTMVLNGDATSPELLNEEGIGNNDLFCALTSSDEVNILSSMLAKKLGAKKTLCLVNKEAYIDMVSNLEIDTVFSPERITAANILRYVRKGGVINVCPIQGSSLEVMEIIIEGTMDTSRVIGLPINQLDLSEEVTVSAIIRGGQLLRPSEDIVIATRDHLILLSPQKLIRTIETYFHINI